eukprot:jgi/Mesvir1/13154/Mv06123-RA.1
MVTGVVTNVLRNGVIALPLLLSAGRRVIPQHPRHVLYADTTWLFRIPVLARPVCRTNENVGDAVKAAQVVCRVCPLNVCSTVGSFGFLYCRLLQPSRLTVSCRAMSKHAGTVPDCPPRGPNTTDRERAQEIRDSGLKQSTRGEYEKNAESFWRWLGDLHGVDAEAAKTIVFSRNEVLKYLLHLSDDEHKGYHPVKNAYKAVNYFYRKQQATHNLTTEDYPDLWNVDIENILEGLQMQQTYAHRSADWALMVSGCLRDDDKRLLQLCDLFQYLYTEISPTAAYMMGFCIHEGKTNKNGWVKYMGILRAKDPMRCAVGLGVLKLLWRWEVLRREPVPDTSSRAAWYGVPFSRGRSPSVAVSYDLENKHINEAMDAAGAMCEKVNHEPRALNVMRSLRNGRTERHAPPHRWAAWGLAKRRHETTAFWQAYQTEKGWGVFQVLKDIRQMRLMIARQNATSTADAV